MTRRRLLIIAVPLAVLASLGLALWLSLPVQMEAFLEGLLPWIESFPKQPYVQNPGPAAMTIFYEARALGQGVVKYTTGRHFDQTAPAELREELHHGNDTTYLYRARLESLQPATEYRYRVVHTIEGQKPLKSRIAVFKTWPDKVQPVTFIVYGDTWSGPETHAVLARQFAQHHPDFIVHTGDLVSKNHDPYNEWERKFFEPLDGVIGCTPLMPVRGNHDPEDIPAWFDLPGNRTWYSFTCGPVHVAVLDCYDYTPEVARWLDQDLAASKSPWKIVAYHEPTINFGGYMSQWRRDLLPIFARRNVDLVVTGHSHGYERFVPLRLGDSASEAATFITTGGGGAELYPVVQHPLLAKATSLYHYCVFQADAGRLTMRALTPHGEEIDRWEVAKTDGRLDAAYLAQAKPVDAAILAQGLILAGPFSNTGDGHATVQAEFPGLSGPARLTVRLADDEARTWDMDPITLEVAPHESRSVELTCHPRANVTRPTADHPVRFLITAACGSVTETRETAGSTVPIAVLKKKR